MPGLIVFRRRWSVGSDDLVVPGLFLFTIHLIWIIILTLSLILLNYDVSIYCINLLWLYKIGYMSILIVSVCIELAICIISMRGSILDTGPRASIHYWLYIKLVVIIIDLVWLTLGIVWLVKFYMMCAIGEAKEIMLGLVISNWMIFLSILVTIWCTFDAAGRSWVKMKKYQRSMKESESRFNYKRSGSMNRNWRQRKVIRAYQDSWDHRCRLIFCCMGTSERNRNSFADIAKLLSDFFRELDVVPSDVVAGLVLLRKFQKLERQTIVRQKKNGTYEFLSGVPITERTHFLALNDSRDYDHFQLVIHYMHYALGAYGWPMFLMTHSATGLCQLCSEFRCCMPCCGHKEMPDIIEDNCCYCNYAALKRMINVGDVEIIYTTFHVDVGETPFFVAIDYTKCKIIVSIRGTLSMKDVLTDLNAEGEVLPLQPPKDDWLGHKGMVQAAVYIKNKLIELNLIQRAMTHNLTKNTHMFGLVLVGHSLGAGTASILAVLLKPDYPSLQCFSYSPPGGLLSMPVVEYTKSFITSVVVGKDVVPRIGLYQMEALRADLINAIKRSIDPKWKTIACSMICCCCGPQPTSVVEMGSHDSNVNVYEQQRTTARKASTHPNDSSIALTLHHPLYPPGRIIHIVRHHPTADEQVLKSHEPVYQAIWVDNIDFDEVLISPAMIQDHMPDTVLAALNKVVTTYGPRKPQRQSSNANSSSITSEMIETSIQRSQSPFQQHLIGNGNNNSINNYIITPTAAHKVCLETSFTSLQNQLESHIHTADDFDGGNIDIIGIGSKTSSIAGSLFERNQLNSILQYDLSSILDDSLTTRSPSGPSEATTVLLVDQNIPYHYQHQINYHQHQVNHHHHYYHHHHHKGKNVAFDNRISLTPTSTSTINSPSPNVIPKSILHRHLLISESSIKPSSANVPSHNRFMRTNNYSNQLNGNRKIDLVHDDWYGMAPLASPETLSEISSISSRASLINNINNTHNNKYNNFKSTSIDRYLQHVTNSNIPFDYCDYDQLNNINNTIMMGNTNNDNNNNNNNGNNTNDNNFMETQLHTPKVMRRTPKISDNLATCADNLQCLDNYKRMGQVFITNSMDLPSISNNSSQGSFESSDISSKENINESDPSYFNGDDDDDDDYDDDDNDNVGDNKNLKLKHFNIQRKQQHQMNTKNECCMQLSNTLCQSIQKHETIDQIIYKNNNKNSNSDKILTSAIPIITSTVQSANKNSNNNNNLNKNVDIDKNSACCVSSGFLESHFPVLSIEQSPAPTSLSSIDHTDNSNFSENTLLLSNSPKVSCSSNNNNNNNSNNNNKLILEKSNTEEHITINYDNNNNNSKKRNTSEDQCFSRNESLPLLTSLSEKSSPTNYVKRKKYVYPMNTTISSTKKNESSV